MKSKLDILYVEDSDPKYDRVVDLIFGGRDGVEVNSLDRATDYTNAVAILSKGKHYDLVLLDIKIPIRFGGTAKSDLASDLVNFITGGEASNPSYIIGLTEFPDALESEGGFPLEYFAIERYSSTETAWASRLKRHIAYITRSKMAGVNAHLSGFDYDVLIVVARADNEYVPILEAMQFEEGTLVEENRFLPAKASTGTWITHRSFTYKTAIVCIQRAGLASAAAVCGSAIAYFRPRIVTMLGMCCGLNRPGASERQNLGDVLIMSETHCWDEGRYSELIDDGETLAAPEADKDDVTFFEARPASGLISPKLRRIADAITEGDRIKLTERLAAVYARHESANIILKAGKKVPDFPKVRVGPNVSGSSVVAAKAQTAEIMKRYSPVFGLEMEAHAIYWATYMSIGERPEAICIKGIADFGDGSKSKEYQKIASLGSLLVFEQILDTYRINNGGVLS
ncbi:hypothetical protein ASF70_08305 [Rhizobium sp. Leaf321]|uniref:5'-methylthioadenosine/S-adenosylhomocysteine nucleosidase family protein n=1 Tax=Rhizobium sp. Leaf321 TaxID=1736335 RepID=UPI000713FFF0|nr:hypothetical protein [Rhizobium sp. Leaf321]KQQ73792.1 hypothetical protein ASF70_08305 [Rhizobium sp. Leaf321]